MAFQPTKEQKQAIEAGGCTLLVSAAAGSGKTAVLVERVIRILTGRENPVPADRLLVVTFTKAAAAEMRDRIALRLEEELRKNPGDAWLARQQLLLSHAAIGTIDSFCLSLLREYFYKQSIPPDFKVADEGVLHVLEEQAMEELLEELYKQKSPAFLKLIHMLGASYDDQSFQETVRELHRYVMSLPFPGEWLHKAERMYEAPALSECAWAAAVREDGARAAESAALLLEQAARSFVFDEKVNAAWGNAFADAARQLSVISRVLKHGGWDEAAIALSSFQFPKRETLKRGYDKEKNDLALAAKHSAEEIVSSLCRRISAPEAEILETLRQMKEPVRVLTGAVREYGRRLEERKLERGVLDFSDVEHKVLELLLTRGEDGSLSLTPEAEEIAARYSEVLVDEYQDTNALQDQIFHIVSGGGRRLFMVGDAKQSIYRFRQADPAIFISRREQFSPYRGGEEPSVILLGANFRSRAGITDYVNFLFSLIMEKETGDIEYNEEERLLPRAAYAPKEGACTHLHLIDKNGSREQSEVLEARHIAGEIRRRMQAGETVADERTGEPRPLRYGDCCILLRSGKGSAEIYKRELKKAGIPAWYTTKGGFLEAPEIRTVLSFLRVIDNPDQDIPLLACLLSPIFGLNPDDVADIRACAPKAPLYAALLRAGEGGMEAAKRAAGTIEEYRRIAVTLPADELISAILQKTGYLCMAQAMTDGEVRRANLLLLLDYARRYETADFRGLSGFLRFLEKLEGSSAELDTAAVTTESADVVRIMTIHRSKGLQFPVCFLGLTAKKFRFSDAKPALIHSEQGIGLYEADETGGSRRTTLPREALKLAIRRSELAEEMRVLYVALTRAKEQMVLLATKDKLREALREAAEEVESSLQPAEGRLSPFYVGRARCFADWLIAAALLHPSAAQLRGAANAELTPAPASEELSVRLIDAQELGAPAPPEEGEWETPSEEIVEELRRRLDFRYPYEELNAVAAKVSASGLNKELEGADHSFTLRPAFLSRQGLTPAERGTALHEYMQFCRFGEAERDAGAELARLESEGFLSPEQARSVPLEKIRAFFASPLYARMKKAERLMREQRFTVSQDAALFYPQAKGERVVLQGVADCVFVEEGGLILVDYKTDRVSSPEELAERYRPQLEVYELAMREIFSLPVTERILYSFHLGREIRV